jgi:HPt (histidine-containing phosphotransfer) domain-containing protein
MNTTASIDMPTFTTLKENMGEDFLGELVQAYFDETPQLISALQSALASGDSEAFRRAAHSIKSTSNSFGALEYGELARELEMMGKDNKLGEAGGKVEILVSEYPNVKKSLEQVCRSD